MESPKLKFHGAVQNLISRYAAKTKFRFDVKVMCAYATCQHQYGVIHLTISKPNGMRYLYFFLLELTNSEFSVVNELTENDRESLGSVCAINHLIRYTIFNESDSVDYFQYNLQNGRQSHRDWNSQRYVDWKCDGKKSLTDRLDRIIAFISR